MPSKKLPQRVLDDLETAFRWGWSDKASCDYAGIKVSILYSYQRFNPEFKDRKHLLRQSPEMNAKRVIADSISSGNRSDSRWYLERRSPEFQQKSIIDINQRVTVEEGNVLARLDAFLAKVGASDVIEAEVTEIKELPDSRITIPDESNTIPDRVHTVQEAAVISRLLG